MVIVMNTHIYNVLKSVWYRTGLKHNYCVILAFYFLAPTFILRYFLLLVLFNYYAAPTMLLCLCNFSTKDDFHFINIFALSVGF